MQINKVRRLFISSIVVLAILFVTLATRVFQLDIFNYDYYIYSTIQECREIETDDKFEATIIKDKLPQEDKYLKDLPYEEYYLAEYNSSDLYFEIFAYEFKDSKTAKKYFENITGKYSDAESNFQTVSGFSGNFQMTVLSNQKAYTVKSTTSDAKKVRNFLKEKFSEEIVTHSYS